MAYARHYRRTRRGRRTGRKLSNYRIATRTSARAQAGQIYALKRRIGYIQRMTRPQTKILQFNTQLPLEVAVNTRGAFNFITNAAGTQSDSYIYPRLNPVVTEGAAVAVASTYHTNMARIQSLSLTGSIESVDVDPEPTYIRIVVVQLRQSRQGSGVDPLDVFTSSTTGESYAAAVFGPLQNGVSRTVKVLSDKRYRIDQYHPQMSIKTRLRYLMRFYQDLDSSTSTADNAQPSETYYKGSIRVLYGVYSQGESNLSVNLIVKMAYSST